MASSHKEETRQGATGIIRGAQVQGVVFCSPGGTLETHDTVARQEKEQLKGLETYWYAKGLKDGRTAGFDEGYSRGQEEGFRKGSSEGDAKGRKEGKAEGIAQGKNEAEKDSKDRFDHAIRDAEQIAQKIREECQGIYDKIRPEIISFSIEIAEAIVRRELSDKDRMKKLIEELLLQAKPIVTDEPIEVFLSEKDFKNLENSLETIKAPHIGSGKIHFTPKGNLSPGDLQIESSLGLLRFDVKRQLADLEAKVLEVSEDEVNEASDSTQDGDQI
jgi:flagellar biosynthesis/type III secretory pathway protein FliH